METKDYIRLEKVPGALVNTDSSGLDAYKRQREIKRSMAKAMESNDERLVALENSVEEIKNLLLKVLENK